MMLAAFCLAYAGFAALALAMERHYEDLFDRAIAPLQQRPLRLLGWVALAISLWLSGATYGWSYGLVEWIGMLAIAGLVLIWILTYRPAVAIGLGAGCAVAAPVFALV
ncbi:MAG: DUF3325 domain-containing protein [Comamonadaceae bacterium]|nr:MAG: DUF3325 domain-containing protein [Comamonadaceae bacterium]